jgi:hypothetical protein
LIAGALSGRIGAPGTVTLAERAAGHFALVFARMQNFKIRSVRSMSTSD